MVVKMKKVELLLYHREKDLFLDELKKAGVVHVTEKEHIAESSDLQTLNTSLRRAERVLSQLKKIEKERSQSSYLEKTTFTPEALIERFEELEESIEKDNQEINALHKEIKLLEPWGEFEPDSIKKLENRGIKLRFFIASEKSFVKIDRKKIAVEEILRKEGSIYFVVIEKGEGIDTSTLQAEEVHLPEKSLTSLKKSLSKAEASISRAKKEMEALSFHTNILVDYIDIIKEEIAYKNASLSMSEEAKGKVLYLRGWFPFNKEKEVIGILQKFSAWFKISDPLPDDVVPVMVQNGPFSRLFEPILKIYSLPDYFELDPTPFFAPFFMLFFGLCFGDLGYGLILTLLGVVGVFKLSGKMKPICMLIIILGLSTSLAGVLLNSLFGHT
ncbi:MAG: hypothetical protein N2053_10150, partial [Chitinispirillaceae bacterium]|nr:hypothetical protein [Chitinispirillaceae bacterium]